MKDSEKKNKTLRERLMEQDDNDDLAYDCNIENFVIQDFVTEFYHPEDAITDFCDQEEIIANQYYDADRVLLHYKGKGMAVNIPEGVTVIGSFAFCSNLYVENVYIPSTVKRILPYAFENCVNLRSVIIYGNSLKQIDYYAFAACHSLKVIISDYREKSIDEIPSIERPWMLSTFPESLSIIDEVAFTGCCSLGAIAFPDSMYRIGEAAFAGCIQLNVKKYPKSLSVIKRDAFSQTGKIFDIPDHITTIEEGAFSVNFDEEVFIPLSVKKIGKDAFDKNHLETINYEGTEEQWKAIEIDNEGDWLKKITIRFNCKRK